MTSEVTKPIAPDPNVVWINVYEDKEFVLKHATKEAAIARDAENGFEGRKAIAVRVELE